MTTNYGELDASIQEKLDTDNDFLNSIADLSDDEKEKAIEDKKSELFSNELKSLKEQAEKAKKAEELANNYKIRAEKAEQGNKNKPVIGEGTPKTPEMSSKDLMALMNAKISEEDVDDIVDYAKYKGISVAEALKSDVVKSTLEKKAEQRKIADATNIGTGRRSSAKIPDDVLLSNSLKGIMPESDEDLARLISLRKPKKN